MSGIVIRVRRVRRVTLRYCAAGLIDAFCERSECGFNQNDYATPHTNINIKQNNYEMSRRICLLCIDQ